MTGEKAKASDWIKIGSIVLGAVGLIVTVSLWFGALFHQVSSIDTKMLEFVAESKENRARIGSLEIRTTVLEHVWGNSGGAAK